MARDPLTAISSRPGSPTARQSLSRGTLAPSRNSSMPPSPGHGAGDRLCLVSGDEDDTEAEDYFLAGSSSDESGTEGPSTPTTSILKRNRNSKYTSGNLVRFLSKKLGRTFNKKAGFRGRAFLPNDQVERERNILQHQLILDVLDGRLFLNPARPKRVLDVGTGPGVWCLEVAQRFPEAQVLGIDVDPVRPPYNVPNCQFRIQDASEPWDFEETFDFIHMRMVGELPIGKAMLFDWMYDHLNPGGWIEITEWLVKFQSANHSLNHFEKWNEYFRQGLRTFGTTPDWSLMWRPVMEKKGGVHITERKHPVPMNAWAPGKRLQRQGHMMAENVQTFLEGATMPVFTGALGWPADKVQRLLANLREEAVDVNVHGFITLNTVYCQKPREGSSISSSSTQQRPSTSSRLMELKRTDV